MASDASPILPEKVIVYYPGRRCAGFTSDVVPTWYNRSSFLSSIPFTNTDMDNTFTGVPGAILIIHDTCQALFNPPDLIDPFNKVHLQDLATQIAQDFYDFRSFSIDLVYVGINALVPIALYDYIEFIYDADEPDEQDYDRIEAIEERLRPNVSTRVLSEPWNGEVQEMQHMDPAIDDCVNLNNTDIPVEYVPCVLYYEGTGECISGGGSATANINIIDGSISSVTVTGNGSYSSVPDVVVSGEGSGATFTAVLTGNALSAVNVTNGGIGYQTAIISFYGGGNKLQLVRRKLCLEDGRLMSTFISYDPILIPN